MRRALEEYVIGGIATTIPFHLKVLESPAFKEGKFYTDFIPKHILPQTEE
jgi:acetyl-CoA carboxylase biotin carboxylase subunit